MDDATGQSMPDRPESSPSAEQAPAPAPESSETPEPKRRHRVIVWSLIVLASVLLILSMTANWVQRSLLNTEEVTDTTSEILADEDVQQQLSTFTVGQLTATVDVQSQLENQLPDSAKALAAPVGAALTQLATDVAERALASPEVQGLVSSAVSRGHAQFVALIEDEGEYVSTTGGEVTLEYGSVVADLATRLGLDPATIAEVQGIVQDFSEDLRQGLTTAQTEIAAARARLAEVEAGELDSELQQSLEALNQNAAELQGTVASLEDQIKGVEKSVPSPLQDQLADLGALLTGLDERASELEQRTAAVLKDPSQANLDALDASLAALETQVTTLLERQAVQNPGELVLMDSDALDGVQTLVQLLRNLGFVLPLLVLLVYFAALFLAKGWRRRALIAAGGGILVATLLVLLVKRLIGTEVVSALASSDTVEPAVQSVWDIVSEGLRERALFVLVIGLAFVGAGWLAGPGRIAVGVRRSLAPSLRDHPVAVYASVAVLFLLWLAFIPGIDNLGQILVIVLLAVLAMVGIAILRRQTAREFSSPSDALTRPGGQA